MTTTTTAPRAARAAYDLAQAHELQRLIDEGKAKSQAEIAREAGVTRARVTQLMNLLVLAPDIQEQILFLEAGPNGRDAVTERKLRQIVAAPLWAEQRRRWAALRAAIAAAAPLPPPTTSESGLPARFRHPTGRGTPTRPAKRGRRAAGPLSPVARFLDHWLAHVAWVRLRFTTARSRPRHMADEAVVAAEPSGEGDAA